MSSRLSVLCATCLLASGAAQAQLQYYGYAGVSDPSAVSGFARYTNVTEVGSVDNPADPATTNLLTTLSSQGQLLVLDLGAILWDKNNLYQTLAWNWQSRFAQFVQANAAVMTPGKLLAVSVRDEPFHGGVDMASFDLASQYVKQQLPWAKQFMIEAGVSFDCNQSTPPTYKACPALWSSYSGSLPYTDWIGIDEYAEYASSATYQQHLGSLKQRWPGKRTIYVMDGYWNSDHQQQYGQPVDVLGQVAWDYFNVARADASAVFLGIYAWDFFDDGSSPTPSRYLACSVRGAHASIGRTLLNRQGTSASTGYVTGFGHDYCLRGYANNPDAGNECEPPTVKACTAYGCAQALVDVGSTWQGGGYAHWACDPDAPNVNIDVTLTAGGTPIGTWRTNLGNEPAVSQQCGGGTTHRWGVQLPAWTKGQPIYSQGIDTMWGSANLPGWRCPRTTPACTW